MKRLLFAVVTCVVLAGTIGSAYVLFSDRWPDGSIVMQLQLGSSGTLSDGSSSWGESAEAALASWNNYLGRVQFRVVRDSSAATGNGNGTNNVFWSSSIYGSAFDSNTLAVTTHWLRGSTRTEADVIFNTGSTFSWNSYSGSLVRASSGRTLIDFRRVALHEFGHAIGLDHPDESGQSVSSIMNSSISNTDALQSDDISGARALYGGATTTSAPGAPTRFTASASGSNVSLAWTAPSTGGSATAYTIEAGASSGASNLANFSTGSTATTFSATGVGAGVYYVRVKATNSGGTSAASNEATMIVGGGCSSAPGAPSALIGSASGGTVTLAWAASSGAPTTYIVEAGSSSGLSNLANSDLVSPATSLVAPNVGRGVYYIRMRGKNACGTGPVSNEIVVIVS